MEYGNGQCWRGSRVPDNDLLSQLHALLSCDLSSLLKDLSNPELTAAVDQAKILSGSFPHEFKKARGMLNPFECLGKGPRERPFLNRSALKLANMDHLFQILPSRDSDATFTWADLCGGPGGFSEYILTQFSPSQLPHHHRYRLRGYGISLFFPGGSSCNWNLGHLHDPPHTVISSQQEQGQGQGQGNCVQSQEATKLFHLVSGVDSTGDLLHRPNIDFFCSFLRSTLSSQEPQREASEGVDFVCGDGGMEEGRDKEDQELIHLPLIISQIVTMLGTLRPGGDFLIKTFSLYQVDASSSPSYLCLYLSVSLSLSVSLCLSLCLSLSVSLCLSLTQSLTLSLEVRWPRSRCCPS
jgi:23S rRNA U2552 (ribose-2'-O)-methylase RlmE/FtsJ